MDQLCQFALKSVNLFSKYFVDKFGNRRTDVQINGQVEDIKPPSASLAGQEHNNGKFHSYFD